MLNAVTFNGICVKPSQDRHIIATDKGIVVLRKQWERLLTSMFLSSASNRSPALICQRLKCQKNSRILKAFFRRREGELTLLPWCVKESIFEMKWFGNCGLIRQQERFLTKVNLWTGQVTETLSLGLGKPKQDWSHCGDWPRCARAVLFISALFLLLLLLRKAAVFWEQCHHSSSQGVRHSFSNECFKEQMHLSWCCSFVSSLKDDVL